jgi:transcriptional regulator with XRE-family HTH domain
LLGRGTTVEFGEKLRELRRKKGLTLRALAEAVNVDFSYLLELLQLADKVPPEVEHFARDAKARKFLHRAQEIASPEDWDALLGLLERRHKGRGQRGSHE